MSGSDNTSHTVRYAQNVFDDHSIGPNDFVVIYNANHIQATYLPDATTIPSGRKYVIMNESSSTLNIISVNLVNGLPANTISPTVSASFVSDGTNWWTTSVK